MREPLGEVNHVYPPSPRSPPAGLTAPSRAYQTHARLAMAGLFAFVAAYLGLTGYLGWVVFRLVGWAILHGGNIAGPVLASIAPLFFFSFLVSGLFVVKHSMDESLVELTADAQPLLFAFLRRLADETGAPCPHRVFVSSRVNAAVFYDLSFRNLLLPSKKNLELGLGLANVLTLDEMKAVVAHEYGHFAQRTMAVGRWVYVAQQVAGHIVMARGVFDRILTWLSNVDLRVAWVGWLMRLLVWAIRAVLDTFFRVAVLAHHALGREMELQADRVAVAVSGSDSLIHALHRLGPADEAWEEAVSFAVSEAHEGRQVQDLFVLQTAALEHIGRILGRDDFGKTPKRPAPSPEHRVFDAALAQPPRMWLTHPPNREREDSAKAVYLPSALDGRSAWVLFSEPEQLRAHVTASLLKELKVPAPAADAAPPTPVEGDVLERFAKRFARTSLDPKYRGAFLGRAIAAYDADPRDLLGTSTERDRASVLGRLAALYPPSLRADLAAYRERRTEEALLTGLADGVLTAPGGVIRYRGRQLRRRELPLALATAKEERLALQQHILLHDRECRAAHLDGARLLGRGWAAHLEGLVTLLHFATHTARNLSDAHSHLQHVLDIALADGRVSDAERRDLLVAGNDVFTVLSACWRSKASVSLPSDVAAAFEARGGWSGLSQELSLLKPTSQNLGDWLRVAGSWVSVAINDFQSLSDVTLDALLEAEAHVGQMLSDGGEATEAPAPAVVPDGYARCLVGAERPRQKRLGWWDRFQTADGLWPGAARVAVASAVLLPALFVGGHIGSARLHLANGLDTDVIVTLDGTPRTLKAHSTDELTLDGTDVVHVSTRTVGGRPIETFEEPLGGGFSHAAYNVAQAAPMLEWSAVYGPTQPVPDVQLGAPRWLDASQDHVFSQPPRTVSRKAGEGARRSVLEPMMGLPPANQFELVRDAAQARAMVAAHLRFDDLTSASFADWLGLLGKDPSLTSVVLERAALEPGAVVLQRAVQDSQSPEERKRRCDEAKAEGSGDAVYLAIRCRPDGAERTAAFLQAWEAHPDNGWLAQAVAGDLAQQGRWRESMAAWNVAMATPALGPLHGHLAAEVVRTQRLARALGVEVRPEKDLVALGARAPGVLGSLLRLEGPSQNDDSPMTKAYRAMASGRGEDALDVPELRDLEPGARNHLLALAAASEGASSKLVQRALGVDPAAVDEDDALMLAALASREGNDAGPFLARSGLEEEQRQQLSAAWSARTPRARVKALEALAAHQPIKQRGLVLAAGLVVLGDEAPAPWRSVVKAALFSAERPYFR